MKSTWLNWNDSNCYPFYVIGKVIKGFGRGSAELGIPTANIDTEIVKNISLPTGIYFGWSQLTLTEETFNQLTKGNYLTNHNLSIFHLI